MQDSLSENRDSSTSYWKPIMSTDEKGEAILEFLSTHIGLLTLIIEGFSTKGDFYQSQRIRIMGKEQEK